MAGKTRKKKKKQTVGLRDPRPEKKKKNKNKLWVSGETKRDPARPPARPSTSVFLLLSLFFLL
jgi:hypothetical protein